MFGESVRRVREIYTTEDAERAEREDEAERATLNLQGNNTIVQLPKMRRPRYGTLLWHFLDCVTLVLLNAISWGVTGFIIYFTVQANDSALSLWALVIPAVCAYRIKSHRKKCIKCRRLDGSKKKGGNRNGREKDTESA